MQSEEPRSGSAASSDAPILIVDDEPSLLRIAARIVGRLGRRTVEASSGSDGLQSARELEGGIALLITDVVMPGMDGIAMAAAIREEFPHIPVLFISGHHREHLMLRHGLLPTASFLQKPFTPGMLMNRVDEMLAEK